MELDIIIVGAGIVGLATAYKLHTLHPGLKLCILEKESDIAPHQSSHNSGVIHSGIYYQPGSLKALNCQQGYRELLPFAEKHHIPHEICGKVIVATREEERLQLHKIMARGIANGMQGLEIIGSEQLHEIEPHVRGVAAIRVPQAGIIDYRDVAAAYQHILSQHGHAILCNHEVVDIEVRPREVIVTSTKRELSARLIINCAGLYADKITRLTEAQLPIQVLPFRGEYYELKKEKEYLVNHLIYPVPNPNFPFLGVHFTRMVKGGIEAGPNAVLAFRREGYSRWDIQWKELKEILSFPGLHQLARKYWRTELDELHRSFSKTAFVKALRQLIPDIQPDDLERGRAGVRAMACDKNGQLIDDFLIHTQHRVVNVLNAPSPAATASLAIGETIAKRALESL